MCILIMLVVPDIPKKVIARVKTPSTMILEVEPPINDGGMEVYGYQIDYGGAQGQRNTLKVLLGECCLSKILCLKNTFSCLI